MLRRNVLINRLGRMSLPVSRVLRDSAAVWCFMDPAAHLDQLDALCGKSLSTFHIHIFPASDIKSVCACHLLCKGPGWFDDIDGHLLRILAGVRHCCWLYGTAVAVTPVQALDLPYHAVEQYRV